MLLRGRSCRDDHIGVQQVVGKAVTRRHVPPEVCALSNAPLAPERVRSTRPCALHAPDVVASHTSTSLLTIYTANGSPMHVSHLGNVSTPALFVSNVYQIPQLTHNLLSVGQLTELGFSITFSFTGVVVQDSQTGQIVGTACKVGRLFELIFLHLPSSRLFGSALSGQSTSSLALWHSCLGHASISRVKKTSF